MRRSAQCRRFEMMHFAFLDIPARRCQAWLGRTEATVMMWCTKRLAGELRSAKCGRPRLSGLAVTALGTLAAASALCADEASTPARLTESSSTAHAATSGTLDHRFKVLAKALD